MSISKFVLNGVTQMDVTDTTATAEDVASGKYFYTAAGVKTAGTGSEGGGNTASVTVHNSSTSTRSAAFPFKQSGVKVNSGFYPFYPNAQATFTVMLDSNGADLIVVTGGIASVTGDITTQTVLGYPACRITGDGTITLN